MNSPYINRGDYCHAPGCWEWARAMCVGFCLDHYEKLPSHLKLELTEYTLIEFIDARAAGYRYFVEQQELGE